MTGWEKVGALTALYVVGMAWANWVMVRRVRGAVASRADWSAADFDAVFADLDPRVAPAVREVLEPWYGPGVIPRPEDTLARFLKMDRGDVEDAIRAAEHRLFDAAPSDESAITPALADVADLTRFIAQRASEREPTRPHNRHI